MSQRNFQFFFFNDLVSSILLQEEKMSSDSHLNPGQPLIYFLTTHFPALGILVEEFFNGRGRGPL